MGMRTESLEFVEHFRCVANGNRMTTLTDANDGFN